MAGYRRADDLPQVFPVFPLDRALVLPRSPLPLQIFEPRYLNMVDDVMAGDRIIGMVQTRPGGERARPRLAGVGCAGRITSYAETPDGRYRITLTGVCRFEIAEELSAMTPYRQVRAVFAPYEADLAEPVPPFPDRARLSRALRRYLNHRSYDIDWDSANNAPLEPLVNSLCMGLPFDVAEKQALLEARDFADRVEVLTVMLEIGAAEDDDDEPRPLQ